MPERREDDQIDPITGIPLSPAHTAIYQHIDDSCGAVMEHQDRVIEEFESRHITERHSDLIVGQSAEQVLKAAEDMQRIMPGLKDFVYGPPLIDPVTKEVLVDGNGHELRDQKKGAQHAVNNGGFRARVPKWLVAIIIALIGVVGSVGVAVIEHSVDTQAVIDQVLDELTQLQQMETVEPTLP